MTSLAHEAPLLHDLPWRSCTVCTFPIPPGEEVGGEFTPRHPACEPATTKAAGLRGEPR